MPGAEEDVRTGEMRSDHREAGRRGDVSRKDVSRARVRREAAGARHGEQPGEREADVPPTRERPADTAVQPEGERRGAAAAVQVPDAVVADRGTAGRGIGAGVDPGEMPGAAGAVAGDQRVRAAATVNEDRSGEGRVDRIERERVVAAEPVQREARKLIRVLDRDRLARVRRDREAVWIRVVGDDDRVVARCARVLLVRTRAGDDDRLEPGVADDAAVEDNAARAAVDRPVGDVPIRAAVDDEGVEATRPAVDPAAQGAVRTEHELILVAGRADEILEAAEGRATDGARPGTRDAPHTVSGRTMQRVHSGAAVQARDVRVAERKTVAGDRSCSTVERPRRAHAAGDGERRVQRAAVRDRDAPERAAGKIECQRASSRDRESAHIDDAARTRDAVHSHNEVAVRHGNRHDASCCIDVPRCGRAAAAAGIGRRVGRRAVGSRRDAGRASRGEHCSVATSCGRWCDR